MKFVHKSAYLVTLIHKASSEKSTITMSKTDTVHIPFWKSTPHLYGCYGGIFMSILVICNFSNLSWFSASFSGYILGRIFYWIQCHFVEETSKTRKNIQLDSDQSTSALKIVQSEKHLENTHESLSVFSQFSILKHQVQPLLSNESNEKIQEIHSLLTILNKKLNNSKDIETRRAIHTIQRVINNYLTPTLTYYQELPVIFHNRPIDDEFTPNQLIFQQLSLVHEELLQITEHTFSNDLNALLEHGLFLEQKLKPTQFFNVATSINTGHVHLKDTTLIQMTKGEMKNNAR